MNGQCIIKYAGAPLKIVDGTTDLVCAEEATVFTNEVEAWQTAAKLALPPRHLAVVDYEEELNR